MKKHTLIQNISVFIATWFYTGFIPPIFLRGMAGTYGSFFSIPLCYLLVLNARASIARTGDIINCQIYLAATTLVLLVGLIVVAFAEPAIGPRTDWKGKAKYRDQNQIVIDETFGMLITYFPLVFLPVDLLSPKGLLLMSIAFLYFRFFDIVKVWPTKIFDNMKDPFGVMLDDGIAGIYAAILLTLTYRFFF
jgi:phosphatidylglycerophosphatase A